MALSPGPWPSFWAIYSGTRNAKAVSEPVLAADALHKGCAWHVLTSFPLSIAQRAGPHGTPPHAQYSRASAYDS